MDQETLKFAVANGLAKCCAGRKRPDCPDCGSADTGSELSDEWYCYACGFQWMKKPHHPKGK